ncbi:MAG TPA: response regulator [Thermoanaerobaculia bacterium]|nr:response regulator [Thermoanaerobaculia bacterium]
MKILIVDDEPAVVSGIEALLEIHGLPSVGVSDAAAAEARIADEFFPVILADLRLRTEEDGLRLLDAVQRLSPRSRVASMTGFADAATEQRLRERGVHTVLHKPVGEEVLIGALREMLAAVETAEETCVTDDELYAATIGRLYAISRGRFGFDRDDAEDLVQETWLLFLEKRAAVRTPATWLSGTLANLCRQQIDRRVRARARSGELMEEPGRIGATESVLTLRQALARLDDRSRRLCTLIGLEEYSYDEASAALAMPLGSVGPSYIRAKSKLRGLCEEHLGKVVR